jgi:GMP synthase (glutamine-hydrolysing)
MLNLGADFVTSDVLRQACENADGIIIGGLGEVGYGEKDTEKAKWFKRMRSKVLPVLREVIENEDAKVLGICLGHQLLGEAMGAQVAFSPEQTELGVTKITLTEEGRKDPLFQGLEPEFLAIEGHRDAVLELPNGFTHLATSEKCPLQSFRYNKYVYGVQFHPELNREEYAFRTSLYSAYSENASNTSQHDGEELTTDVVIKNFINLAVTQKK